MISPSELALFVHQTYAAADRKLSSPPIRIIVPKAYAVPFTAMAFGTTQTQVLQIGANGDFFMTRMYFNLDDPGLTSSTAVPQIEAQITDSGSDEQFFNQAVLVTDIFNCCFYGNSPHRHDLPYPRVVTGRSSLSIQLTSLETATSWTPWITFEGALVKTMG